LQLGDEGMDAVRALLDAMGDGAAGEGRYAYSAAAVRLRAPLPVPTKILCIGQNYRDHVLEQNARMPEKPIIFAKFTTAVIGPGDDIIYPTTTRELDYEAELVVVIGKTGKHIARERAYDYVAGYIVFTGTPPGVGAFRKPPMFLQVGDEVTVEVEKLGRLTNRVAAER